MRSRYAIVTGLMLLFLVPGLAESDTVRWTLATGLPDGSKPQKKLEREARKLARRTGGRLQLNVSGIDGNADQGFPRVLSRDVKMDAALVPAFEYAELVPGAGIYGQPFLFSDITEVQSTRKRFDPEFIQGIQHDDFVVLGVIGLGFSYLMSDRAISDMVEIKDSVVHVPFDAGWIFDMLSSLSLHPRHDVSVSDTMLTFNSPTALILDKRIPRPEFVVIPPVQYGYMLLVVRRPQWLELSADNRQILTEFFMATVQEIDAAAAEGDRRAIRLLQRRGMRLLPLPEEDIARMRLSNAFMLPGNPLQERLYEAIQEIRGLADTLVVQ